MTDHKLRNAIVERLLQVTHPSQHADNYTGWNDRMGVLAAKAGVNTTLVSWTKPPSSVAWDIISTADSMGMLGVLEEVITAEIVARELHL